MGIASNSINALTASEYQLFRTRDIDEARHRVGQVYCDHRLSARKGILDAFHYHMPFQGISINYMGYGPESEIEPGFLGDFYLIQLPVRGTARIKVDDQLIESHPGKASVLNPSTYTKMTWSDGCEQLLVQISKEKVRSTLSNCAGTQLGGDLVFDTTMENNNQRHSAWWRHVLSFIDEYNRECSFYSNDDILNNEINNIVKGLLYSLNHNHSELLHSDPKSILPKHIRTATDYIRDHAGENVSIEKLVQVTGVSEKSLFNGFKSYLNMTPMQFLLQTRLANVRQQLLKHGTQSGNTVTQIAMSNGFTQLGRFSSIYKKVFGELPSETLKRPS